MSSDSWDFIQKNIKEWMCSICAVCCGLGYRYSAVFGWSNFICISLLVKCGHYKNIDIEFWIKEIIGENTWLDNMLPGPGNASSIQHKHRTVVISHHLLLGINTSPIIQLSQLWIGKDTAKNKLGSRYDETKASMERF